LTHPASLFDESLDNSPSFDPDSRAHFLVAALNSSALIRNKWIRTRHSVPGDATSPDSGKR